MFNNNINRLDKKSKKNLQINRELTDLNESVQYHSDNVDEVKSKLQDIERQVEEINLDEITEDFVSKTKKKRADLED